MKIIFCLCCYLFFALPANCQNTALPKQYVCYQSGSSLDLDGIASEDCWEKAAWTDDFIDITGDQRLNPPFRTRAKMLWDQKYFYVFAEIYEPHIWANLRQRDTTIFLNNDFEVFIDPDGDTHDYFEYEMNALNTQWDLKLTKPYRDGGIPITSWNFDKMISAVSIEGTLNNPSDIDRLWRVEIAFPIKSMIDSANNKPLKNGDQWRVNFSRVEWQTLIENGRYMRMVNKETGKPLPEDNWVWSPQGSVNMHIPDKWGIVQFSDIVSGKGTTPFKIDPENAVKDELRILYYAQQKYHSIHKKYAGNLDEINSPAQTIPNTKFNPEFKLMAKGYEITAKLNKSPKIWHINEKGRVWPE